MEQEGRASRLPPPPLPDGTDDHGPPRESEDTPPMPSRKREREEADEEETATQDVGTAAAVSERLPGPATSALRLLQRLPPGAELTPILVEQPFVERPGDYRLSFQLRVPAMGATLEVVQGATRDLDEPSEQLSVGATQRLFLLDQQGQVKRWQRHLRPEATVLCLSKWDTAVFVVPGVAHSEVQKRMRLLTELFDEYTQWLGLLRLNAGTVRVMVACRAAHERSTVSLVLAHTALAAALGEPATTQALATNRALIAHLEPRRPPVWVPSVLMFVDTVVASMAAAREQRARMRQRPLECIVCQRPLELLKSHVLVHAALPTLETYRDCTGRLALVCETHAALFAPRL